VLLFVSKSKMRIKTKITAILKYFSYLLIACFLRQPVFVNSASSDEHGFRLLYLYCRSMGWVGSTSAISWVGSGWIEEIGPVYKSA